MYHIVDSSNSVGDAITVVNKTVITLPSGFTIGDDDRSSVTLVNENNNETIFIEDLGKSDTSLDNFKNDLNRLVDEDEINDFLNEHDNLKFKSTSAKLEENNEIHELFQELGEILYNNDINGKENKDRQCSIRLTSPQKKEKTNYCICYSLE